MFMFLRSQEQQGEYFLKEKKMRNILAVLFLSLTPSFICAQPLSGARADALFGEMDRAFDQLDYVPTPSDEYFLGRAVAANILTIYRPYTGNAALTDYLNLICQAIVVNNNSSPAYNGYHVMILDSQEFNALSTPGGHIFLTKGLVESASSEDALAGIIAHELAHIQLKHGVSMIESMRITSEADRAAQRAAELSNNAAAQRVMTFRNSVNDYMNNLIRSGYSAPQEFEADSAAVSLLVSAGYSPRGLLDMLNVLQRLQRSQNSGLFGTHPSPAERITNADRQIRSVRFTDTTAARTARFNRIMGR
jgi:predicted Zn-dependent protease